MDAQSQRYISYAATAILMAVVFWFRFRSMAKTRPLKLNRLWIVPGLYSLIAGYFYWLIPPVGLAWLYAILGLIAGIILGWQRGKMMRISVDPETNSLMQKASPAAMLFIAILIALRIGSRAFVANEGGGDGLHGSALLVTDVLIAMALGFLSAQRVEMYVRAKRLLEEASTITPRSTSLL